MDIMAIKEFIQPELSILVVVLYCVGLFIRNIPTVKNWIIPLVLWASGVVISILYIVFVIDYGFNATSLVTGFTQGTLIASMTVFGNEIIKQVTNRN